MVRLSAIFIDDWNLWFDIWLVSDLKISGVFREDYDGCLLCLGYRGGLIVPLMEAKCYWDSQRKSGTLPMSLPFVQAHFYVDLTLGLV